MQSWFEHLENFAPHTILNEAASARDLDHLFAASPTAASISYRYYFHVFSLAAEVRSTLEALLEAHLRPDADQDNGRAAFYIDGAVMEEALKHLQTHLSHAAPVSHGLTLFLLNLNTTAVLPSADSAGVYGYRHGMSEPELSRVLEATGSPAAPKALRTLRLEEDEPGKSRGLPADLAVHDESGPRFTRLREAIARHGRRHSHDVEGRTTVEGDEAALLDALSAASVDPASAMSELRRNDTRQRARRRRSVNYWRLEKESAQWAADVAAALRRDPSAASAAVDAVTLAARVLERGTAAQRRALVRQLRAARRRRASALANGEDERAGGEVDDCLTDTWVGASRVAWMDFGAGPFDWGPLIGGRGLRLREARPSPSDAAPTAGQRATVPPADSAALGRLVGVLRRAQRDLESEMELVRDLASLACAGDGAAGQYCDKLRKREARVEAAEVATRAALRAAAAGKPRAEVARLYEAASSAERRALGNNSPLPPSPFASGSAARGGAGEDAFLAAVGASVSALLRTVVAPPSTFPPPLPPAAPATGGPSRPGSHGSHDAAVREIRDARADEAAFVSEPRAPANAVAVPDAVEYRVTVVLTHRRFAPADAAAGGFDLRTLRRELIRLRLPGQEVRFVASEVHVGDDPALGVALATATRSAVLPTLSSAGLFSAQPREFFDSAALRHQLVELGAGGAGPVAGRGGRHTLVVPVFVLSTDEPRPVLIDKYHVARAVGGMVFVAQADHTRFPSPFRCNGRTVTWDLMNPVKHAVVAAASVAAGITRTHLLAPEPDTVADAVASAASAAAALVSGEGTLAAVMRSTARSAAAAVDVDWEWSVGASASALTSTCATLPQLSRDVSARHQLMRAALASAELVNAAAAILSRLPPRGPEPADAPPAVLGAAVRAADRAARAAWQSLSDAVEDTDFVEATRHARSALEHANALFTAASELDAAVSPFACFDGQAVDADGVPVDERVHVRGEHLPATSTDNHLSWAVRQVWALLRRVLRATVWVAPVALLLLALSGAGGTLALRAANSAYRRLFPEKTKVN